jgi:hypothetical protein
MVAYYTQVLYTSGLSVDDIAITAVRGVGPLKPRQRLRLLAPTPRTGGKLKRVP